MPRGLPRGASLWNIVHNGRWQQGRVLQHSQSRCNDCLLVFGFTGYSQGISVTEWDSQRTRRPHLLGDLTQQLNCNGGNTLAFEFRRHQTHGLVAYRSDRHQQGHIDTIFNQFTHCCRRGFFYQAPGGCNGSHKGQMPLT